MTVPNKVTAGANLRAAKQYAQAGYPVLLVWPLRGRECVCGDAKCKTPGKHPIVKAWQHSATTDVKKLEQWWARHPSAHVGVMPPEGHCIIDVDPRNGGTATLKGL